MTPCGSAGAAAVSGTTCVADGGIETVLIFDRGLDLPCFASFPLLADKDGRDELLRYFEPYARLAADRGLTAVFDTPTWRANADWGAQLGYAAAELDQANRQGVALLEQVRASADAPVVIRGSLRHSGNRPRMTPRLAAWRHSHVSTLPCVYVDDGGRCDPALRALLCGAP